MRIRCKELRDHGQGVIQGVCIKLFKGPGQIFFKNSQIKGISYGRRGSLKERILEPYLKEHFWWMGDGVSPMNNWTIWCTQNVLMTAALWEEDEEISRAILQKAAKSADFFLAEYGDSWKDH